MLKGTHLIAGQWIGGESTFTNEPVDGAPDRFAGGTPELVDQPCLASKAFMNATSATLEQYGPKTMLTAGIAQAYHQGRERVFATYGMQEVMTSTCDNNLATPSLFKTTGVEWLAD